MAHLFPLFILNKNCAMLAFKLWFSGFKTNSGATTTLGHFIVFDFIQFERDRTSYYCPNTASICLFTSLSQHNDNFRTKFDYKRQMVCLGFEPRTADKSTELWRPPPSRCCNFPSKRHKYGLIKNEIKFS